jgi:23S rRNA pseudouridine1911/1915/1917 synthase
LASQFFDRTTERIYHALVWGDLEGSGTISGNIARSQKNRKVMAVYSNNDQGKHAVTHYRVLERFGNVTLVECKLETGRTHQIRVHFQHIGHPLFNDLEYGGNKIIKGITSSSYTKFIQNCFDMLRGQALHAKTLGFKHPLNREYMNFDSNLPLDFSNVLIQWRKYKQH